MLNDKRINEEKNIYNTNNRIAYFFILGIIVFVLLFPFFMEYIVLRSSIISVLTNSEWSSFLGSFVGGSIGGIGTLLAVYLTTQDTKNSFRFTKENIDYDRRFNLYNDQKKFTNDIAISIAEFSTDMENYAFAIYRYKVVEKKKNDQVEREKILRSKMRTLQSQTGGDYRLHAKELEINQNKLKEIEFEIKEMSEKLDEKLNNIRRIIASNNYFLLKVKLSGIESATEVLVLLKEIYENTSLNSENDLSWIKNKIVELQECTHKFIVTNLKEYKV